MQMPGRQSSLIAGDEHRYGHNGEEMDNEVSGHGNTYAYLNRMYDPRLGRFMSPDPMADLFPSKSPYVFVCNNPILLVDQEGDIPILPLLIKAAAGAAGDFVMQFTIQMIINDFNYSKAMANIDYYSIGASALQGMNPFGVPKPLQIGMDIAVDIGVNYFRGDYDNMNSDQLAKALIEDILVSSFSTLMSTAAGKQLKKHSAKIAEFLKKQGVHPARIKRITGIDVVKKKQTQTNKTTGTQQKQNVKKNETDNARRNAVNRAWTKEKNMVKTTGEGTRKWADEQKTELLARKRVTGYVGHHTNSVKTHPELAGKDENITFVHKDDHIPIVHGGNTHNSTSGPMHNRPGQDVTYSDPTLVNTEVLDGGTQTRHTYEQKGSDGSTHTYERSGYKF
jgi:RHS repeat-associated protein